MNLPTFPCALIYRLVSMVFQINADGNNTTSLPNVQEIVSNKFPDQWYELPLDHFNLFDNRTFKMRYLVNNEFYKEGGPLFVYVAGETTIDASVLQKGALARLAKEHMGMIVTTEHRYYGKSLPLGEDFSTENLKYLQIGQALEDLAQFIEYYKTTVPGLENSTVIVHGCSYPGMLVTWLRLKYPNIVDIAYASSAPLGVGLEYPQFYEIVYDTYANVSKDCIDNIKLGFNITQQLAKTRMGLRTLKDALRGWGCGDINSMNSNEIIFNMVSVLDVMHDPKDFEQLGCLIVTDKDYIVFNKFVNLIKFKSFATKSCCDVGELSDEDKRNYIAWNYQTCTELGSFQTLKIDGAKNPFACDASLEESIDACIRDFGEIMSKDVLEKGTKRVSRRYGGRRPKVTKVITVQGINDPWRDLAVLEDYTPDAPVLLIKGSHCIDITERSNDDNELKQVRDKIRNIINGWIDELKI